MTREKSDRAPHTAGDWRWQRLREAPFPSLENLTLHLTLSWGQILSREGTWFGTEISQMSLNK